MVKVQEGALLGIVESLPSELKCTPTEISDWTLPRFMIILCPHITKHQIVEA